jgi:outer membrane protein TolC
MQARRDRTLVIAFSFFTAFQLVTSHQHNAAVGQEPAAASSTSSDPVKKLLVERLVVYTEIYNDTKKAFDAGEAGILTLLEARASQLRADLDLRERKAERIQVHEELVTVGKQSLEETVKLAKVPSVSRIEVLKAKARLLEAQIALEKERKSP